MTINISVDKITFLIFRSLGICSSLLVQGSFIIKFFGVEHSLKKDWILEWPWFFGALCLTIGFNHFADLIQREAMETGEW